MKTIAEYLQPQTWNLMRMLRIVMGSVVLYQGLADSQWLLAGVGGIFLVQGILNAGCGACAGNSCEVKK